MPPTFTPTPNREAVALIAGRKPVAAQVFYGLLPKLRARAFTVSGLEGANVLQRVRDALAALPQGIGEDGQAYTWDTQKQLIADELEPYLGEEGAQTRAQTLLRTSGFQAFTSTIWNLAQADADTTHLQYIHGDQAKVPTPSHLALDGIILPKDDPFWKTHTGPWGHIGCVCYVRPMNEDLVNEARAKDQAQTNPEARNVLEGPVADELRNGTLMRDGRRHSVSPPEGDRAFQWHPDDLRLPLDQVMSRYDPPVRTAFESWARKTDTGDGTTVWNWLNGAELKATPTPPSDPSALSVTPGIAKIDRATVDKNQSAQQINEHQEYADPASIRENSERFFARGKEAFGQFKRIWRAPVSAEVLRSLEAEWSAQVAAVATGRKPLFHDSFGDAAVPIAESLRKFLPSSVEVRSVGGELFVYRPSVIMRMADPSKPLWDQVRAHSDDGVWMGYGANLGDVPTVKVHIVDAAGNKVSGFLAPSSNPDPFAKARTDDFILATGKPHSYVLVK